MLAGALFVAVFFALLTNAIVGRRIEESLARPRPRQGTEANRAADPTVGL
jgi:hypothetical protein